MSRVPATRWCPILALTLAISAPQASAGGAPGLLWQHEADIDGRADGAGEILVERGLVIAFGGGGLQREPGLQQHDFAALIQGLRAATGSVVWSRRLDSEAIRHAVSGRGRIFAVTENSRFSVNRGRRTAGGRVLALDAATGETLWETEYDSPTSRQPGVHVSFLDLDGGRLVYGGLSDDGSDRLAAFIQVRDAASGALVWEHVGPEPDASTFFTDGAASKGRLYVTRSRFADVSDDLERLASAWSLRTGTRLWEVAIGGAQAIEAQRRRIALLEVTFPPRFSQKRHKLVVLGGRSGSLISEVEFETPPHRRIEDARLTSRRGAFIVTLGTRRIRGPHLHRKAEVHSFAARSGQLQWRQEVDGGRHPRVRATRRVALLQFVHDIEGTGDSEERFHALDAADGASLWKLTVADAFLGDAALTDSGLLLLPGSFPKEPTADWNVLVRALR